MTNSGRFDLSCLEDPKWLGSGRYGREGDAIRFQFDALARRGEVLREKPQVTLEMAGEGNRMRLRLPGGKDFVWQRMPPR
ncbi:MAG TPA: hypothetical protein VGE01_08380, partial [Fimbriimonas sp.]